MHGYWVTSNLTMKRIVHCNKEQNQTLNHRGHEVTRRKTKQFAAGKHGQYGQIDPSTLPESLPCSLIYAITKLPIYQIFLCVPLCPLWLMVLDLRNLRHSRYLRHFLSRANRANVKLQCVELRCIAAHEHCFLDFIGRYQTFDVRVQAPATTVPVRARSRRSHGAGISLCRGQRPSGCLER